MNGAGERRRVAADVTHAAGRDQEEDRPAFRTDPRVVLRPTQRSPLFFDPGGMLMEAHDRAVDQGLCRRGPSNATITSEALMTALADGRSQVPSANTDRGPK